MYFNPILFETLIVEYTFWHFHMRLIILLPSKSYAGTGSTSWTYNVNKLTEQNMEEILTIVKEETGFAIRDSDTLFVRKITNKFNEMLITNPGELCVSVGFFFLLIFSINIKIVFINMFV